MLALSCEVLCEKSPAALNDEMLVLFSLLLSFIYKLSSRPEGEIVVYIFVTLFAVPRPYPVETRN